GGLNIFENSNILHELSSVSEDGFVPFLLDKLKALGFEAHLVWLQKQLLEAAYVKLAIKDPTYRIHVEEPVAKFYALQSKPIPMIPWNEELEEALSNPYFHLLQQSLGLYTNDDPASSTREFHSISRPCYLLTKLDKLVPSNQVGHVVFSVKFDVDTLKESSNLGSAQVKPDQVNVPLKTFEHTWLNVIQKMNGDFTVGSF
ncbi:unnamed protein product, partial [Candidula unifasciata]